MTVTITPAKDTITLSSSTYTYSNTVVNGGAVSGSISGVAFPNAVPNLTVSTSTGYANPWTTTATPWLGNGITADGNNSGKIKLTGENADIEVNGESLMGLMKEIRERLNLFTLNEKMEKEWDELHELGNQYRALEAKLKEQGEMWAKLKAMPTPNIE